MTTDETVLVGFRCAIEIFTLEICSILMSNKTQRATQYQTILRRYICNIIIMPFYRLQTSAKHDMLIARIVQYRSPGSARLMSFVSWRGFFRSPGGTHILL